MNKELNVEQNPLGSQPILRLLMKFAIPSVISMVVMAVYNIVDQIFIGWSPAGYLGNAATTVVFPLVTVMLSLALLIGNGSSAYMSLQMGRGDTKSIKKLMGNALILVVSIGILLAVLGCIFLEPILNLLGATDAVMPYALEYGFVIMLGAPFAMLGPALSNVIRADGSPRYSMMSTLVGALLNVVLDPIFIFAFGMGVKGAAIATVISQFLSAVLSVYYITRMGKYARLERKSLRLDGGIITKIASYGSSSFVTQVSNAIVNVVLNKTLVHYGQSSIYGSDIPLSAMGIVMKINMILVSVVIGIAIGAQPILGFNYGAKKFDRVRKTYFTEIALTITISTIGCILFVTTPETFISAFGDSSPEFKEFASKALSTFLSFVFLMGFQMPSANYFQAVGKPLKAMILTMSRQLLILVPAIIVLPMIFGFDGILYAAPFTDVVAVMLTSVFIFRELRHLSSSLRNKSEHPIDNAEAVANR